MISSYRKADLEGRRHFAEDFGSYYITAGTENDYDRTDVFATARTNQMRTYLIEIKAYCNKEHPREYAKFIINGIDYGYQIDYDKIDYMIKFWKKTGRIPILYARFTDFTLVWDLRDIADKYEQRKKWKCTNKDGLNYGGKEWGWQTYLYKDEAKYKKETAPNNN